MAKSATDVAQILERILFQAATTIKIREKDLRKWPDDPEHLHQYRISIRVARSLIKFIRPYQMRKQNLELGAALKQLQDPTSRMRELDVLVDELEGSAELQEICRAVQLENRAAFIAQLESPESQEMLALVLEGLSTVRWNRHMRKAGIRTKELSKRIRQQREACEAALGSLDFEDLEAVHDLRKQAKSLRYVSRELEAILPDTTTGTSTRMREVQDALGQWCDARVNAALVTEIFGEDGRELADAFSYVADQLILSLKEQAPA